MSDAEIDALVAQLDARAKTTNDCVQVGAPAYADYLDVVLWCQAANIITSLLKERDEARALIAKLRRVIETNVSGRPMTEEDRRWAEEALAAAIRSQGAPDAQ